jgi:hypothetical protein
MSQSNDISGAAVKSLTEQSIKSYYNMIPPSAKRRSIGYYNPIEGMIQWLFRTDEAGDPTTLYEATHILNLDLNSGAFYPWVVDNPDVKLHSVFVLENVSGSTTQDTVIDGANTVVDGANTVISFDIQNSVSEIRFKYLTSYLDDAGHYQFTFAQSYDEDFVDFASFDDVGTDYTSYFVSGYRIASEVFTKFDSNLVTIVASSAEPSHYKFQAIWNYGNTGDSGKWSLNQIMLHSDEKFDFTSKKVKVRGSGRAIQFKVTSISGEAFNILGWSALMSGNTQP